MGQENEAEAGILRWMNSIRFQIAMDPARQFFQNQVHEQGFQFLDDYWECILAGPRDEYVLISFTRVKIIQRAWIGPSLSCSRRRAVDVNLRQNQESSVQHHSDTTPSFLLR